jgi:hypothetical protein
MGPLKVNLTADNLLEDNDKTVRRNLRNAYVAGNTSTRLALVDGVSKKYNDAVMKDTVLYACIKVLMYQVSLNKVEILDIL